MKTLALLMLAVFIATPVYAKGGSSFGGGRSSGSFSRSFSAPSRSSTPSAASRPNISSRPSGGFSSFSGLKSAPAARYGGSSSPWKSSAPSAAVPPKATAGSNRPWGNNNSNVNSNPSSGSTINNHYYDNSGSAGGYRSGNNGVGLNLHFGLHPGYGWYNPWGWGYAPPPVVVAGSPGYAAEPVYVGWGFWNYVMLFFWLSIICFVIYIIYKGVMRD